MAIDPARGGEVAAGLDPTPGAELARLRLVAQRIAGPAAPTPREAVRLLAAMQAQDHPGALLSVALRTAARSRAAVEEAMTAGTIVKSWPMRGTLHLVAAEDLRWMLALLAPRTLAAQAGRRAALGLGEAELDRARQVAAEALGGGRELHRAGLLARWEDAGVATTGQRGYHLILHLAQSGMLCFGPVRDGEPHLVLLSEWVPETGLREREESLGELARRYFRGHGPASAKDLARWAGLTASDTRIGIALTATALEKREVNGLTYYEDPATADHLRRCRSEVSGVFLLPGFDEYMLGYGDRTAALPAEHAMRIVPGGNGVFQPTVVVDGQVVATWRRPRRGSAGPEVLPFTELDDATRTAVGTAYAALP